MRKIVLAGLFLACLPAVPGHGSAVARQHGVAFAADWTLDRINAAARDHADRSRANRVVVSGPDNTGLAGIIADNDRRRAEAILAAMVIEGIARDPGRTAEYVAAATTAAPDLRDGLIRRVRQAFPYFATAIDSAATAAPVSPVAPVAPVAAAVVDPGAGDANPQLAGLDEADGENDAPYAGDNDPLEGINRAIFFVNDTLDTWLFRPLAWTYGKIMPDLAKRSIRNVVRNLKAPIILANDLFQGEITDSGVTLARLAINTTIGLGGLFEVAEEFGLPYHEADFGQTLHAYDIGSGPYLMLPILGPATLRHGLGQFVDAFFDPLTYFLDPTERIMMGVGKALVRREEILYDLDELRKTSVDYYAAIRSLYFQDRAKTLRRGAALENRELDRLFESVD